MLSEKLQFYLDLRLDSLVQELHAEQRIRQLSEDILQYAEDANKAAFNNHRRNNTEYKPLEIDFQDVKDIAYTVGTFKPLLADWGLVGLAVRRILLADDPFSETVKKYSSQLKMAQRHAFYDYDYSAGVRQAFRTISNPESTNTEKESAAKLVANCANDYRKRAQNLSDLAMHKLVLKNFYKLKRLERKSKTLEHLTPFWGWPEEPILRSAQLHAIPFYLWSQAQVDELKARTLYSVFGLQ